MGTESEKKTETKFNTREDLAKVKVVIEDAEKALKDTSRKIADSPISTVLTGGLVGGLATATVGTMGTSVATVSALSGVAVGISSFPALAIPIGIIGATLYSKNKRLNTAKELVYKEALAKQTAILKALKEEQNADKERIEYLNGINILLQSAIKDLENDLKITS